MAAPISDQLREQILAAARAGEPRNAIARRLNVARATVSKVAAAAGVRFDRTATAAATAARVVDQRAARVTLAGQLLDDAQAARGWLPLAETARDLREAARAVYLLTSAHCRLVAVDAATDRVDNVVSLLDSIAAGLTARHGTGDDEWPAAGDDQEANDPGTGDDQEAIADA